MTASTGHAADTFDPFSDDPDQPRPRTEGPPDDWGWSDRNVHVPDTPAALFPPRPDSNPFDNRPENLRQSRTATECTGRLVWDSAEPLKSVQTWQTEVVKAGVGARALRVAIAMARKCDTRTGNGYLTDDTAREEFGIARTALHEGRAELAKAGLLRKAGRNNYGVQTWDLTTPD